MSRQAPLVQSSKLHAVSALVIVAFTVVIYSNTLTAPFLFDDRINIVENPYIRITELSTDQIMRAIVQDEFQLRPLSNLSFGLDYYFHQLDRSWMHAENLALHALAAIFLYFIVGAMIALAVETPLPVRVKWGAALAGALLWCAHPAHTQAVTYLVQRQTVLSTAFLLGSFLAYVKARASSTNHKRYVLYALALAAFVVSAGSKEIGWSAPVYWLLFEIFFVRRRGGDETSSRAIIVSASVLAAGAVIVTIALIKTGLLANYLDAYQEKGYGPMERLLTEPRVVVSYLITMFFPHPVRLALDHDVSVSRSLTDPATTLFAAAFLYMLFIGALLSWRKMPLIAFLGLGFFIALAPESSFIPLDLKIDHRIYFYSIFIIPATVAWVILGLRPKRVFIFFTIIIALMGVLTFQRNKTWGSRVSVWSDSARKSPGIHRPWNNLCAAFTENETFFKAVTACDRAIKLKPDEGFPYVNKGIAFMHLGREKEAGELFSRAVEVDPDNAVAHHNLGAFLEKAGRTDEAVEEYKQTVRIDQLNLPARHRLSVLLRETGELEAAFFEARLLTRLYPDHIGGWLELAKSGILIGRIEPARNAAHEAIELEPRNPEAWHLLGSALRRTERFDDAEKALQKAIEIYPSHQRTWIELGFLALDQGNIDKAKRSLAMARRSIGVTKELESLQEAIRNLEAIP